MYGLKHDPVEDTEKYQAIKDELHRLIEEEMAKREYGWWEKRFVYWAIKKRILMDKYGIVWWPPPRWNPTVRW